MADHMSSPGLDRGRSFQPVNGSLPRRRRARMMYVVFMESSFREATHKQPLQNRPERAGRVF